MKQAAVTLIISDGLILSVSRRYDHNKFGLPGGKVSSGEEPWEAAIRETKEETSLDTGKLVLIYRREEPSEIPGGTPFYTFCYFPEWWQGVPQNSEEGVVKWLTAAELTGERGAFPEYNRKTINMFKTIYPTIKLLGEE